MKKLLFLLFLITPLINVQGQSYTSFPTHNAFWSAMHCEPGPFERKSGLVKVGVFGDTVINAKTYHKLYLQRKYINSKFSCDTCGFVFDRDSATYFLCFREENKIVYFVPQQNGFDDPSGTEYPVFNFNLSSKGETILGYEFMFMPFGSYGNPTPTPGHGVIQDTVTLTVESVDNVRMSDGSLRKRINFKPLTYGLKESWIEGIGSTKGFGLSLNVTNSYNTMVCFSHNGIHLGSADILSQQLCTYHPDTTLTFENRCEYTIFTSVEDKAVENNINVFPNPGTDYVIIKGLNPGDEVTVIDILGQVVYEATSGMNELTVNIKGFNQGIYLYTVKTQHKGMLTGKIVKLF